MMWLNLSTMYVKSKQFNLSVIDELNKVINVAKQFVFFFFSLVVHNSQKWLNWHLEYCCKCKETKLNYELNSVLTTSLKQKQEAHVPHLNIPKTYLKFRNKYIFDVMNCCKLLTFIIEKFQCDINSFEYVFLRVLS